MFSDALDRETAWLSSLDALPTLPVQPDGSGYFKILQARSPRTPATSKTQLYVARAPAGSARIRRFSSQRTILTTDFRLMLLWPLTSGRGDAEADQLIFEQVIDQVLLRVEGPIGDKTHGGRFMSVGEGPQGIGVHYDPAQGIADGCFQAQITYTADDPEYNN